MPYREYILINTETIKLPFSLIDYLIVHDLCHVVYKDHSKAFWTEVGIPASISIVNPVFFFL